ncbi:uncharacterized protein SPSC_01056 [Sporisorium scitamineum]|uniref:Uncharacterized protein n=1 Tax=Sporisorium scitamineum TaxID=49012 RepID=A0A0F7S8A8_9BASI|nr:uncharacterized protein SPSC_01056 [Sporisorium scitamineum]CDW98486.1 hypothetical protein [Sporisorium scitamineum]
MVHPLVITAAATAGLGAAVAFEVAVFGPWREENWPHGFGEGVRSEFLKFRREFEEAVTEIRNEFRTRREDRRRGSGGNGHRRLSDGELDDLRRGVGEEASSESAQHEFEMHERQASAYRDRLRASMSRGLAQELDQPDSRLRRRRPAGTSDAEGESLSPTNSIKVPVIDVRTPSSPEVPHHSLGDASPSVKDAASLHSDSRFNSVGSAKAPEVAQQDTASSDAETDAAKRNGSLGLDFGPQAPESAGGQAAQAAMSDPFADIVDGTASSWHAVFSDRTHGPINESVLDRVAGHLSPAPSSQDLAEEAHVVLDTNGLSQTLSDQRHSFHDLYAEAHDGDSSDASASPYHSNRALHSPIQDAGSNGSRSDGASSESDFEVLSDTAESEGRWQHLEAPPSPTISSGSEAIAVGGIDAFSVTSDGQDSWAELSEPGSDVESFARRENSVRSPRG